MQPGDQCPLVTLSQLTSAAQSQLTDLRLCLQPLPPSLFASPALQHLHTLHLSQPDGFTRTVRARPAQTRRARQAELPTLKALRHLVITHSRGADLDPLLSGIRAYFHRLESLKVNGELQSHEPYVRGVCTLTRLVRPVVSHRLRHLTLSAVFQPQLAVWLQQCTPCLRELTLTEVSNLTERAADVLPVCSWHTLRLSGDAGISIPARAWAWLPLPAQGQLSLQATGSAGVVPSRYVVHAVQVLCFIPFQCIQSCIHA